MWLPWSFLCVIAILVVQYGKTRFLNFGLLLASVIIYIAGYLYQVSINASPSLFDNKYPPNLYYLIYGVAGVVILTYLNKLTFIPKIVSQHIHFLSTYSYSLYFIHYTLLSVATYLMAYYSFTWYTFFAIVFIPSVLIQWIYVKVVEKRVLQEAFSRLPHLHVQRAKSEKPR